MPRSQSDRAFGFKSPGLLRILTAADPGEVLTAMEALGITFIPEPSLLDLFAIALGFILGPIGDILDLLEDVDVALDFVFANLDAAGQLGPQGKFAQDQSAKVKQLRAELRAAKDAFQEKLIEEREKVDPGTTTAVI